RGVRDEMPRLRDSKKEAFALGMRDGDGPAVLYLLNKFGNHTTVAAKDVTEPDRGEAGGTGQTGQPHRQLRCSLGGAHDARGPNRLVGRNQNKAFDSLTRRSFCDYPS